MVKTLARATQNLTAEFMESLSRKFYAL